MKLYTTPMLGEVTTRVTPRAAIALNLRDVYGDSSKVTEKTIDRYYELQLRPGNRKAAQELFEYAVVQAKNDSLGMSRISMPTLILWGGDDDWVPTQLTEFWRRDVPHAEIIIYPGVGHVPMEEIPQQSVTDLKSFLLRK
jgi:pimeloyl-ACP methyl ester carboxylesterase